MSNTLFTKFTKFSCFYAPFPKGKYHRLILINIEKQDRVLQFLTIQSFINKIPAKYSFVEIPRHFWKNELKNSFSFIVCEANSIVTIDIDNFINLLNKGKIKIKIIPDVIINDIKKAILKSVTFTDEEKQKILY